METAAGKVDLHDVEMVFGAPPAAGRGLDVHSVTNEKNNGRSAPKAEKAESELESHPAQPLLEPPRDHQLPPLAGPEIDDLDEKKSQGSNPASAAGIDDGLLEGADEKPADHHKDGANGVVGAGGDSGTDGEKGTVGDDDAHTHDGNWREHDLDETDFYYGDGYVSNGIHNRFGEDRPGSPMVPMSIPDVNTYQQKKNLAQGMMDLALLSANANQLRYVLESSQAHPYFFPSLVFISCSIILQIAVGVGLILNSRYNVKDEKDICKADKINNMTVLGIFLITIVNVFITSFSVASPTTTAALQQQQG